MKLALATVVFLAGVPALLAEGGVRPVSIGARISVLPFDLMRGGVTTVSTTGPTAVTQTTADPASGKVKGGFTLQFGISQHFAISADMLFRRAGFNREILRLTGTDNTSTSEDERELTTTNEETTASYWEFPLLARYYPAGAASRFPFFFSAGGALRYVRHVRTHREITDNDDNVTTNDIPINPVRDRVTGIVAGFGFQIADDLGIKVMPEVRYTRWRGATFDADPARSRRDQFEVLVGFVF